MHWTPLVREPAVGLIMWLRPKGLKVYSYVEKYAKFKNQSPEKIAWYIKLLWITEYPWGRPYSKISTEMGHPISQDLIWPTLHPKIKNVIGANLSPGTPWISKKCSSKINSFGLCENAWLPWQLVMRFLWVGVYIQIQLYFSWCLS